MRGGVLGENHLFEVLIGHGAGHLGAHLGEVGAGVAVEVALEVAECDHPFANAGDNVGRNRRLAMAGGNREERGSKDDEAAHGAGEV